MRNFTEEELSIAKSTDLVRVAETLGYTPQRIGHYFTLKEMDSLRIYDRTHWFRWSRRYDKGSNGGSQIDFLRVFQGMEVKEAVFWLVEFAGYSRDRQVVSEPMRYQRSQSERKPFILPQPCENNRQLYRYLCKERCISEEIVQFFVEKQLIYESSPYHNIVFKGNDKNGVTHFASMRGVFDRDGKSFKCDVAGNDKRYGFNVYSGYNSELHVFEAAIDLMSYADMTSDTEQNMIALGMLSDAPLITYLSEHQEITKINLHLDNDEPGRKATQELLEKYSDLGYLVEDEPPLADYKDMNEMLQGEKNILKNIKIR